MGLNRVTLADVLVLLAVACIALALVLPEVASARRCDNERHASAMLKTVTTAESDFRQNDRDGNGVADFWTADVHGLYGLGAQPILLIERDVAAADGLSARHLYPCDRGVPGAAFHGYALRAFAGEDVEDDTGAWGPTPLANDTDGPGGFGAVHDRSRFAFMAFPTRRQHGGLIFVVNADNTIWRYYVGDSYVASFRGMTPDAESTSTVMTHAAPLMNATFFPASPGSLGCSKGD